MKVFWIYTGLRFGLFLVCLAVIAGVWYLVAGRDGLVFWPVVGAAAVSSVLSLRLLEPQRQRLAAQVQERATRASSRFEEARTKEDAD